MQKISLLFGAWLLVTWFASLPMPGFQLANTGMPTKLIAKESPLQIQATANDPLFVQQDNLKQLKVESAWDITTGNSFVVALIDTGINAGHEDLVNKLWVNQREVANNGIDDDGNGYVDDINGYNFIHNTNDILDNNGHGTSVASIIAASTNNNKGIAGINWNAKIMALKALNSLGGGEYTHVISAIRYAVDNGARVINMSFGTYIENSDLETAVNYAISKGVTVVAAAGNNSQNGLLYPANYPSSIAVGAVDDVGIRASFSNYGSNLDIMAPGVNIPAAHYEENDTYARYSGTSYAAAHITGLVSLMLAKNSSLTPPQIESLLKAATLGSSNTFEYGSGLVDARKVLDAINQSVAITANIATSTNSLLANGTDSSQVTITIKAGNSVAISRSVRLRIKNGPVRINDIDTTAELVDLGATDSEGKISFRLSSYLPGEKQLTFIDAVLGTELGSVTVQFNNLSSSLYKADLVSKSPDLTLSAGDSANLWVELKNTGNVPWSGVGDNKNQFRLGAAQPKDRLSLLADDSWISGNRAATLEQAVVYPGEVGRISFNIKTKSAGTYKEYFSPVVEYISWFNLPLSWNITVKKEETSNYQVELISRSGDIELNRGEMGALTVVFKNTGNISWPMTNTGAVRLGTTQLMDRQSRFYGNSWVSKNRATDMGFEISPGSEIALTFAITAPDTAGVYYESFKLVSEYVTWFGPTVTWRIKVI